MDLDLIKQKEEIKNRVFNPSSFDLARESYHFSIFSANMKKFLPHIESSKYRQYFQEKYYYQYIAAFEQDSLDYLDKSNVINNSSFNFENQNNEKNYAFAAFHLGSYRTIISYLIERGLKVALIIDESVFSEQLDSFKNLVENILRTKDTSDLIILNVNDRKSIFKLKQLVDKGYVMAVYLDGNTSLNSKAQDFSKGFIPINFFNQEIFVKNGVGKLASILNADVITCISHRDKNEVNTIEFYKEISLTDFSSKTEYSIKSIEICYSRLEEKVSKYPTQWECWGYIHNWFKRNKDIAFKPSNNVSTKFNLERYTLYEVNDKDFIFDLITYKSYPISKTIRKALELNKLNTIDNDYREALESKNIII